MPPKKKGKKGKKSKEPELTGPEAEEAMERKLLIAEAKRLKALKEREEMEFNEFQQQKEKLNYFWIVEKKQLEDKKAELRNKEREMQDLEEKHHVEVKVYKQRVKHLLFEHQDEVTEKKTEGQVSLKMDQDGHRESQLELRKDIRALQVARKELERRHESFMNSLKHAHDEDITNLRLEFEREAKELSGKYEDRIRSLRGELEDKRKASITRIEERKAAHIASLMSAHQKAFGDIKNYYNDITHSNLDLIKSLKEEVAEMKKKEAADEKLMFEIAQENKRMSEPLKRALADVKQLRTEREAYRRDLEALQAVKRELLVAEEELRVQQWEREVLQQRFDRLSGEKRQLHTKFQDAVYNVQQKAGFRNLLLEKKLAAAGESLEKKEAQVAEVLASANVDGGVSNTVVKRLDEVLEAKDATVRELQAELQRVIAAHNRLLGGYERKLREYGVPVEELGFEPIREGVYAGAAPKKAWGTGTAV
jgi:hypothetical protein